MPDLDELDEAFANVSVYDDTFDVSEIIQVAQDYCDAPVGDAVLVTLSYIESWLATRGNDRLADLLHTLRNQ